MHIRLDFKVNNVLQLGPGELTLTDMSVSKVIDVLSVNQHEHKARWDRQKWVEEHRILIEVTSPLLGLHTCEVIGLPSDMEAIAEVLKALSAP